MGFFDFLNPGKKIAKKAQGQVIQPVAVKVKESAEQAQEQARSKEETDVRNRLGIG